MCASDKQRDMWLGAMLINGAIEPNIYKPDPSLRRNHRHSPVRCAIRAGNADRRHKRA